MTCTNECWGTWREGGITYVGRVCDHLDEAWPPRQVGPSPDPAPTEMTDEEYRSAMWVPGRPD